MIFVLLTFGGWNEAAYLAGEVRDARRNMLTHPGRAAMLAVTALYLLVNLGYLAVLGLGGIKESKAVAADVMRAIAGDKGAVLLALLVCVSVLTTMNAAIFTGARTTYALGRDFGFFGALGAWRESGSTPANALILQGVIDARPGRRRRADARRLQRDGGLHLAGVLDLLPADRAHAVCVPRKDEEPPAFHVPLYPVVPIAFCLACLYMLYSSINYVRFAVAVRRAGAGGPGRSWPLGIPLYFRARRKK